MVPFSTTFSCQPTTVFLWGLWFLLVNLFHFYKTFRLFIVVNKYLVVPKKENQLVHYVLTVGAIIIDASRILAKSNSVSLSRGIRPVKHLFIILTPTVKTGVKTMVSQLLSLKEQIWWVISANEMPLLPSSEVLDISAGNVGKCREMSGNWREMSGNVGKCREMSG